MWFISLAIWSLSLFLDLFFRNPYLFIEVMDAGLRIAFVSVRPLLCCHKSISPQSGTCMYMLGSIISLIQESCKTATRITKMFFYESIRSLRVNTYKHPQMEVHV